MKILIIVICLLFSINTFAQDTTAIEEEVFTVVEDMPCFPGCEDLPTSDERKQCTERNLLKFVYQNMKFTNPITENGIEGLIVLRFIVNTQGRIENVEIIKGLANAKEVKRVLESMNDLPKPWRAGMQRGKKVKVKYNLPMRINLKQN